MDPDPRHQGLPRRDGDRSVTLRAGHGTGKGSPRVEVLPPDEQPSAMGSITDRSDRTPDGRFAPGNGAARAGRLRPGALGGVDTSAPEFRPFAAWGRRYASHHRAELAKLHGGEISAGVGALVESASLALAASRYAQHLGSSLPDVDLLKRAGDLSALARQHELAAWELGAREAAARKGSGRSKTANVIAALKGGA